VPTSCSQIITTNIPTSSFFYRLDALPVTQPTVSKHWREIGMHIGHMNFNFTLDWHSKVALHVIVEMLWYWSTKSHDRLTVHVCLTQCKGMYITQYTGKCTLSLANLTAIFPGGLGLAGAKIFPFWILLELRMITGVIRCAKLQSECRHKQTTIPVAQPTVSR